ncbi:MAG: O-antigen ligase family protein [Deltaproteobacteria bacterium]|nr:O-antigen ligase family protein [Deltaproteobacteria bacterium]
MDYWLFPLEVDLLIILLITLLSIITPNWFLLIIAIPFVIILSYENILPFALSINGADIYFYDIMLIVIFYKIIMEKLSKNQEVIIYELYKAILYFISSLLVAIMIAYYNFGEKLFIPEIISYLRLLSQILVLFLTTESLKTAEDISIGSKSIDCIGYIIAGLIYLNIGLFRMGITIGEVQNSAQIVRYFGLIGDSTGFLLLFFIIRQILFKNIIGIVYFVGALFATGTRGCVVALLISLLLIAMYNYETILNKRTLLISIFTLLLSMFIFYFTDLGGMRTRFIETALWDSGSKQRLLTMKLGVQIFADNPVVGVGYTGFRFIAEKYEAEGKFRMGKGDFTKNYTATVSNQFLQVAADGGLLALFSFLWLMRIALLTLKSAKDHACADQKEFFEAGYLWLLTLLIGAQTACWMLPSSLISYLLWVILGSALASIKSAIPAPSRGLRQFPRIIYQMKST